MTMKRMTLAVALVVMAMCATLFGAMVKTYQVTGPVLELKADMIVVQKGSERWEIARDATTKVTGDLKVGAKVTIEYRMTAASVTVKAEAAGAKKKK
jgi:hypothetical protein